MCPTTSFTPARLDEHVGTLHRRADGTVAWTALVTPRLLRTVLGCSRGVPLRLEVVGSDPIRTWIRELWFDVDRGTLTIDVGRGNRPS